MKRAELGTNLEPRCPIGTARYTCTRTSHVQFVISTRVVSSTWLSLSRLLYLRSYLSSTPWTPRLLLRSLDTNVRNCQVPCALRQLSASTPNHSDRSRDDAMRKGIFASVYMPRERWRPPTVKLTTTLHFLMPRFFLIYVSHSKIFHNEEDFWEARDIFSR